MRTVVFEKINFHHSLNFEHLKKKVRNVRRKKQRIYYYEVLKHCLKMRQKMMDSARDLQLGSTLPPYQPDVSSHTAVKRKINRVSLEKRVKHRYYQELISIKKEIGDSSDSSFDENYPGTNKQLFLFMVISYHRYCVSYLVTFSFEII